MATIDMYIAIGMLVLFGGILGTFLYQTRRRNRDANVLTLALGIGTAGALLRIIIELAFDVDDGSTAHRAGVVAVMMVWGLMYVFIYVFFEQLERVSLHWFRGTLMAALYGSQVLNGLLYIITRDEMFDEIFKAANAVMATAGFGFAAFIQWRVHNATGGERTALIQAMAISVLASSFVFDYVKDFGWAPMLLGNILQLLGMLTYFSSLISNVDYIYRLPYEITDILIFDRYGPCVYTLNKYAENTSDEQLLSGLISALNSMVKELKPEPPTPDHLVRIDSLHRTLHLAIASRVGVAVMAHKRTYFLQMSTNRLLTRLVDEGAGELLDRMAFLADESVFELIMESFPYLDIIPTVIG